jgi:uncharacterized membrane protein SirB2
MSYLALKYIHIVFVAASFALFFIRGLWAMRAYPPAQETWVRVLPHVVDGVLVLSALGMLLGSSGGLWAGNWLAVKIGLVVLYAILSIIALRVLKSTMLRMLAWLLALAVFLFATSVAVLRNPLGLFLVI